MQMTDNTISITGGGAVLANQGHDLSRPDLERGLGERVRALNALVDIAHDEERRRQSNRRNTPNTDGPPIRIRPSGAPQCHRN